MVQRLMQSAVGRRTKLTCDLQRDIVKLLEQGASDSAASAAVGIAQSSYYLWRARGESEDTGIYHDFLLATMMARARARMDAESRVYIENPLAWLVDVWARKRQAKSPWLAQVATPLKRCACCGRYNSCGVGKRG